MILSYGNMKTQINTTVDVKLKILSEEEGLKFNEALTFGLKFKLADRCLIDYPECSLLTKIQKLQELIKEANIKIDKLEGKTHVSCISAQ